jgi:predicted nuclease of predicted toxin-antitoxin system
VNAIVLDQGLAPRVAEILNRAGWDAVHVSGIGFDRAQDEAILEYCERTKRVCVTLDHDFHQHLAISRSGSPSVVLLREEGMNRRGGMRLR